MERISHVPLNEKELKELSDFLGRPFEACTPMSLTQAHGALCAVLSTPRLIRPSQWQSLILDGSPVFDSMEQAVRIVELLGRFHNQIQDDLRQHKHFAPLIFKGEEKLEYQAAPFEMISKWCKGYLEGAALDPFWTSDPIEDPRLFPFEALAEELTVDEQDAYFEGSVGDMLDQKNTFRENLPFYIQEIYEKPAKPVKAAMVQKNAKWGIKKDYFKIGRNEICPCGSGLKYKKCCSKESIRFY